MDLHELWIRTWHDILSRAAGPMHFRLVIQPLMAIIFAVRSGLLDSREDRPPFLAGILWKPDQRTYFLSHGWKDISKVFIMAVIIDVIYTLTVFKHVYSVETLLVAVALSIAPYLLVRGPLNRLMKFVRRRE